MTWWLWAGPVSVRLARDTGGVSASEFDAVLPVEPEEQIVRAELDEARKKRRSGRARVIGIVASVAVVGGVFVFALPRIADYREVWEVVKTLSLEWVVALVLVALLNLATYGPPLVAALPGISYLRATRVTLASTALSSVAPGGAARPAMARTGKPRITN